MMSQTPLQVRCNDAASLGSCQVECYTKGGALFKGIMMFVLVLLGAILSIVLPGLHFITVPLGVVASPIVGIYYFISRKGKVKRITGNFSCPNCEGINHVAFRGAPPYSVNCVQCQHALQLSIPDSLAA
jgi:hypothetical protein